MTTWNVTIRGKDDGGEYAFVISVDEVTAEAARRSAEQALEPGERVSKIVRARNKNTNRFRRGQ